MEYFSMAFTVKKLLEVELKEDLKEVEERRKHWSKQRLQREGYAVFEMKGSMSGSTAAGESIMRFTMSDGSPLPYHQFQAGDVVVLRSKEFTVTLPSGSKTRKSSIDASIVDIDNFAVLVTTTEPPIDLSGYEWRMDKGTNRIAYDRMHEALNLFAKSQQVNTSFDVSGIPPKYHPAANSLASLKSIILDESAKAASLAAAPSILDPLHNPLHFPQDFTQWKLNESQRSTIKKSMHRTLSLIQGPPGTGKTTTVVQLIKLLCHLYKGSGITILACAYTNVATDNLLEGCLDFGLNALRLGRPVKVRPELRQATLEARTDAHHLKSHLDELRTELQAKSVGSPAYRALRDTIAQLERSIVQDVMKSAQVICSTCIYAGDPRLKGTYFPVVIIDECTQATEPAALVPIVAGGAQQVILVGDHHQLPPTVKSEVASKGGLADSLFSRLIKESKLDVFLLNTQYRMHPVIAEFPSAHFYSGKLLNGVSSQDRQIIPGFEWQPRDLPVAFLNMPGSKETRGSAGGAKSWVNNVEAVHLVDIVKDLLNSHLVPPKSIGIITPYSAQVRLIFELLNHSLKEYKYDGVDIADDENMVDYKGHGICGITISSVDGFQGREKDIILFSAVRSNKEKRVGFLKDWRRLNVALTRAKRGVIVIGDGDLLASDKHWSSWIDWIESKGGMRTFLPPSEDTPPLPREPLRSPATPVTGSTPPPPPPIAPTTSSSSHNLDIPSNGQRMISNSPTITVKTELDVIDLT
jgi:regulator of nonsense transcripts 1